ncbi:MAG: epsF 3 [Planctomycetaceae bacterium]|nr:epsF 3 [Planctomycetaceae bacterium]
MHLILAIISGLGLLSVVVCLLIAAGYGVGLILLVGQIRNVRQEISRERLGRFLLVIGVDHFVSAIFGLILCSLLIAVPAVRGYFPLINGPKVTDEAIVISVALIMAFFSMLWTSVGVLLVLIRKSLISRGAIQRELDWEPWLTVVLVAGVLLQIPTLFFFLLVCAPLLLQVRRLMAINRQGNLIWTLSLAVRRQLPLGKEVRNLSEGLWGRQRLRLELLSENLDAGQSLSNSLERQPGLVPLSVVTQLRLGEDTGTLSEIAPQCGAAQVRSFAKEETVAATQNAFMILLLPITFLPLVMGFVGYWIVPKHKKIFEDFGVSTPELTRTAFALLDGNSGFPAVIGLMSIACVISTIAVILRDRERDWPFLTWLVPRTNAPLILRSLALLVRENRPLATGLRALESSHARLRVRAQLKRVLAQLDQGSDAWEALASQRLVSRHDLLLLRAAERIRNLPWALEQIAETIERRSWNRLRVLLEVAFPVITIAIGLVVLGFIVAFTLPLVLTLENMAAVH